MSKSRSKQKIAAWVLLIVFSVQTFYPITAYALTSGPASPEMSSFQPASTANMVDLFSGDFSYNIPLVDVGGYPVNLSYNSGAGPEEEASWVGFGWNLNPGAINRQLRGLPDDFSGDQIEQTDNKKANITVGGNVNVSLKIFGFRVPKLPFGKKKKKVDGSLKVKIGIQHNNYTGYKGTIGIGVGFGTSNDNSDELTQNLDLPTSSTDISGGIGINVDNQAGVNPYANFEVNYKVITKKEREAEKDLYKAQVERSVAANNIVNSCDKSDVVNSQKLQEKFFAAAQKVKDQESVLSFERGGSSSFGSSSSISFQGFNPPQLVQTPMISKNFTASLSLGVTFFGLTGNLGIEGTFSKQELKDKENKAPAYGFINSHLARANEDALLDYNVEKESPYFKRLPNLGVTVFTPDLYSVTSNAGSMQFRSYLRGAGIYFRPHKHDVDKSVDIGLEPAFGNIFHLGIPLQLQKTNNISGKWTTKNNYINVGDFQHTDATHPEKQAFVFRRVGEKNQQDTNYFNAIGKTSPVAVKLDDNFSSWAFGNGTATTSMRKNTPGLLNGSPVKTIREKANHSITYLTGAEASKYALNKSIPDYTENMLPTLANSFTPVPRVTADRKAHHISQYTVTQDDGQRMVYGVPVYNTKQEEISFATNYSASGMSDGITTYSGTDNSTDNGKGKDNYFHKYKTPAYTTGHLLSAILSPDYVDVTGNGVSDDDLGTAVKFNYSLIDQKYKWRTPYTNKGPGNNYKTANYNGGYESIPDDDRANYTWGEKELWYLHSIESKTMVAQFITQADRNDGAGVLDQDGQKDLNFHLRRLMEIRLYSKSDLYINGTNAIPIKTVHFQYASTYPIMSGLPNNTTGGGKLTLEKVWFTYGNNSKGIYNRYEFKYNIPSNNTYDDNQSDRWGFYKPKSANPNGLNNLEFPYSTQNKTNADNFASYWQLNEIELPSGAIINVQYESDDYSFVQDRRATQMCFVESMGDYESPDIYRNFASTDAIYIKIPVPLPLSTTPDVVRKRYFDGLKSLAYKAYMDLDGKNHWEYVSGYADITAVELKPGSTDVVKVSIGKINGKYNPIAKASWQKLKLDLPRFAFPEYDNLDAEGSGFIKAIKALAAAFGRFKDLVENFDQRSKRKGFGNRINIKKSWVRLTTPIGINNGQVKGKLGGGHRVKQIQITDQWSTMSGVANAETGTYGQRYEYTTTYNGPNGEETISSGVASYEPAVGGDENPFHEPINYVDKALFGMPKYFYLERPMGESYFPGASVGYSKVTVKNLGADGSVGENGSTVNEFYTAKDFPTKVNDLPIEKKQPNINFLPRLFGATITSGVTVSQGYVVENNDMHGKPKAEAIYNKNGSEISSAKYHYKVDNPSAEKLDLNNNVPVVNKSGTIENATVGMDIDMFTEMNQSTMENLGIALDPSFGVTVYVVVPKFSIRLPIPKPNYEKRLFRGSSTIKLVNRYAILEKSVKTVNGSTNTAENLLWDAETGEVLLSRINNEFNENIYTFNYPAHWRYDGMGSSFKNEGIYLSAFQTDANGAITTTYNNLLVPGDELIDLVGNKKYWVIKPEPDPNPTGLLYLADKAGSLRKLLTTNMKIERSGRRNLAMASIGSVVTMNNPISGNTLSFSNTTRVLQASSVNYDDNWKMPIGAPCPVTFNNCIAATADTTTQAVSTALMTPYISSTLTDNYGIFETRIYTTGYDGQGQWPAFVSLTSPYWTNNPQTCSNGPVNRAGVWVQTALSKQSSNGDSSVLNAIPCNNNAGGTPNHWLGHTFNYNTTSPQTLYVAMAGDNFFRFSVNGTVIVSRSGMPVNTTQPNFRNWNVYPICLAPGNYTFQFQALNAGSSGMLAAEVYDNTLEELQAATSDQDLTILFSTRNLVGQTVETGDGIGYIPPTGFFVKRIGVNQYIGAHNNATSTGSGAPNSPFFNPYQAGIKGNWRVAKELLYDTKRVNNKGNVSDPTGTDLRNSGYFENYDQYWVWTGNNWTETSSLSKWQWTSSVTKFNRKGQEIENVDALARYSGAQHGYLESLPVAVAANAKYREIGYDGFEDYNFNLGVSNPVPDACSIQDHFSFRTSLGAAASLDNTKSHSGKYSLRLTGNAVLEKPMLADPEPDIYGIDGHRYKITNDYMRFGFQPIPSRKYVISGWVNDGQPKSPTINNLTFKINNTTYNLNDNATNPAMFSKVHVVEGWKRFEVVITLPGSGNFKLELGGNNINVDDIRVHPYDAQLKSFAYDPSSLRLMAEMDENNFATFYEYDDEGTLIRVKKETEKGISTIKETRSSVRKKNP